MSLRVYLRGSPISAVPYELHKGMPVAALGLGFWLIRNMIIPIITPW